MAPERMKMRMQQQLRQEQHLTPQLMQSMEILQMNSQELLEYLNRAADENPMLEREEAAVLRSEYEQLRSRISWRFFRLHAFIFIRMWSWAIASAGAAHAW